MQIFINSVAFIFKMAELKDKCPKCGSKELDIRSKEYKYMPGQTGRIRHQYCLDCDWEQALD